MHRTPDYNEGLHLSQFVGSNRASELYEDWCKLPESLKTDLRITAWQLYNAFKSCWRKDRFCGDGESTVFNLYEIGCAFYGHKKFLECSVFYTEVWDICQKLTKIVFPSWEYENIRVTPGGTFPMQYLDQPRVEFFRYPFFKINGRYIDAKDCKIVFPNPTSSSIFMGRLRALSQKRRYCKDGYEEFPLCPLARTQYRSQYYLSLWPETNIDSSTRSGCRRHARKVFRQTKRVDGGNRKYLPYENHTKTI